MAARGWQAVALDLPGHGATPRLSRPLDLDTLVDAVADRLPGPVDLRTAVQALLPPGRFVVLDGSHCLHRDQPDRWLESVTTFADATLGS